MAEPKKPGPDKFRVGQRVVLKMTTRNGWRQMHGAPGVVLTPRVYGTWRCGNFDGTGIKMSTGWHYSVRTSVGVHNFDERMLRRPYDGEQLSTWGAFAKATGIDLAATCLVAQPVKRQRKAGTPRERSPG